MAINNLFSCQTKSITLSKPETRRLTTLSSDACIWIDCIRLYLTAVRILQLQIASRSNVDPLTSQIKSINYDKVYFRKGFNYWPTFRFIWLDWSWFIWIKSDISLKSLDFNAHDICFRTCWSTSVVNKCWTMYCWLSYFLEWNVNKVWSMKSVTFHASLTEFGLSCYIQMCSRLLERQTTTSLRYFRYFGFTENKNKFNCKANLCAQFALWVQGQVIVAAFVEILVFRSWDWSLQLCN